MPELPEMETYRSLLQPLISGQMIAGAMINREKSINVPADQFMQHVLNQKIIDIKRRAKYLVFQLQDGSCLLLHLMLGGKMFYGKEEDKPDRTVQVQVSFGDYHLYFIGLRLGYLHLLTPDQIREEFKDLGPEPFQLSQEDFLALVKDRRGGLKSMLLNQEVIAGIGNRYSDEILWHAQLLPERKVNDLDDNQLTRLYQSVKHILMLAIQQGGYMDPLYKGDGRTGQYEMNVHGRKGEPCPRCGTPIAEEEISSRKTCLCTNCQH